MDVDVLLKASRICLLFHLTRKARSASSPTGVSLSLARMADAATTALCGWSCPELTPLFSLVGDLSVPKPIPHSPVRPCPSPLPCLVAPTHAVLLDKYGFGAVVPAEERPVITDFAGANPLLRGILSRSRPALWTRRDCPPDDKEETISASSFRRLRSSSARHSPVRTALARHSRLPGLVSDEGFLANRDGAVTAARALSERISLASMLAVLWHQCFVAQKISTDISLASASFGKTARGTGSEVDRIAGTSTTLGKA